MYTIVKAYTLEALIKEVNNKIGEGWEPVGSAQECQPSPEHPVAGWFFQSMIQSKNINILAKGAKNAH